MKEAELEISVKEQLILIGASEQIKKLEETVEREIARLTENLERARIGIWTQAIRTVEHGLGLPVGFISSGFSVRDDLLIVHGRTEEELSRARARTKEPEPDLNLSNDSGFAVAAAPDPIEMLR